MSAITLIKLGGSLITDKERPRTPHRQIIERLAQEIAEVRERAPGPLLIGHGSGSFGHAAAAAAEIDGPLTRDSQRLGVSATQSDAAALHRLVVDALHRAGAHPFSIAPSSCMVTRAGRTVTLFVEPLIRALRLGLTPVLYGDVVVDRSYGAAICSTETILWELAVRLLQRRFEVVRALWLGATPGLYDESGETIPELTPKLYRELVGSIHTPRGIDVTGGMELRLETTWKLAGKAIPSLLLDGRQPGVLTEAVLGQTPPASTRVPPRVSAARRRAIAGR